MITKERLQELIEQGATIYILTHLVNKIRTVLLYKKDYIRIGFSNKEVYVNNNPESIFYGTWYKLEDLFETKKEAEFVQKFHTSKTVYFEPPTWEEFLKTETIEKPANWSCGDIDIILHKKYKPFRLEDEIAVINGFNYRGFNYINKNGIDNRKQKYYEAVEYAKKVFLGEEK